MAGVPPKRAEAYTFYVTVTSQANTNIFQGPPTIQAGDFQYSNDGGATFNNPATLPAASAGNNKVIRVVLSAAEMTPSVGDKILFIGSDVLGAQWQDYFEELTVVVSPWDEFVAALWAFLGTLASSIVTALMAVAPVARAFRTVDLELYRGDTWTQPVPRLGNIAGRDELWIACKEDKDDLDSQAVFLISETVGLEIIDGGPAAVPANGSVVVTDAAVGNVTVTLAAVETAKLDATKKYWYDVQMLDGAVVTTLRAGRLMITSDVVRATS